MKVAILTFHPERCFRWPPLPVIIALSIACLLLPAWLGGQDVAETDSAGTDKTIGILPVPAFGYSIETRGYVGAVALVTTDCYKNDSTRISNGKVEVNYTQNRQWIFTVAYDHYFPKDDYILATRLEYLLFPEYFYGIGNETRTSDRELYESRRLEWFVSLEQRLFQRFYAGLLVQGQGMWDVHFSDTGKVAFESVPGIRGATSSGAGYSLRWDNRDVVLNATRGWLVQWQHTVFDDLLGSDARFQRLHLDVRKFQRIARSSVLAFHGLALFHTNEPPMRMLALMGGDAIMRGYYTGRYRDRQLLALQAVWRLAVFWRGGGAPFAGSGRVGRTPDALALDGFHPSYGGGLRFRVDDEDNINLRFDYARGRNGGGFYVAFGEAF